MGNIKKKAGHSFMANVSIILFAQIMVKILGAVYRVVITNINGFGDEGLGFYNAGFQVYTVLLAISSVGIPNAIAKMVSERAALNDYRGAHRIFKTSFLMFTVIGLICSALLYFGSDFVALNIINMDGAQYTMRALSPSIFFVCISSVMRGYFQGLNNMKATSYSQILEQIFKCTLTVLFVVLAMGMKPEIMAAWANFASSTATLCSFIYLVIFYNKNKKWLTENINASTGDTISLATGRLMKSVLMLSIPISLASIITSVNRVIDLATITRCIEIAFSNGIPAVNGLKAISNPTAAELNNAAVVLSGILSKSDTLINLPLALNTAFSTVLVPSISGALATGNIKEATSKTSYSMLISILLIIPCAFGYIALAKPIYSLIYPNASLGYDLLQLMSISLIFSALSQTMAGALQGLGKVFVPAIGILVGSIFKIIINILLIRIPSINIYGAAIGSIVCQFLAFIIPLKVLTKHIPLNMGLKKYILKPVLSGLLMGAAAIGVYKLLMMIIHSNVISLVIAIAAAALVYFACVLLMKIFTKEEILDLPAGGKLYGLIKKTGIYKD